MYIEIIIIVVLILLTLAIAWYLWYKHSFYPTPTGKIVIEEINLIIYAIEENGVNIFAIKDGENIICIDAGYHKTKYLKEFQKINVKPEDVSHILLTHTDHDHAGGIDFFPNAKIFLSQDEIRMINGTTPRLFKIIKNPPIERPYTLFKDGEIIKIGNCTFKVIATPGHTPGSVSFLLNKTILFVGDTLTLRKGYIKPFYGFFNMDTQKQLESIEKLIKLENIKICLSAHTGYTRNFSRAKEKYIINIDKNRHED